MKLKSFAILLILTAALTMPALAHDDHDDHHSDHGHTAKQCIMASFKLESGGFLLNFKDQLKLTDDQQKKLLKMSADLCGELHPVKEEIVRERNRLKLILAEPQIDLKAYESQLKKVCDMEYGFKCRAVAEFQKARELLSEQQKQKLKEILKKHFES